jgi:methyl-accepting chemotaxis protein
VVAGEVKNLASQTARATEDIQHQVARMREVTAGTVASIGAITRTITQIREIAAGIASAVGQQRAAAEDISRNLAHAASETCGVRDSVTSVTMAAEETGLTAGIVLVAARSLSDQSAGLSREVDKFTRQFRAV